MLPFLLRTTFWKSAETPSPAQRLSPIAALLTLTISSMPLSAEVSIHGTYSSSTSSGRDPALDQTFFAPPARVTIELSGIWLNRTLFVSPLVVEVRFSPAASETFPDSHPPGLMQNVLVLASPLQVSVELNRALSISAGRDVFPPVAPASWLSGPVLVTAPTKQNWVKWTTIGALDFTILKDNLAGERPLDWKGKVYALKMLGSKVVAYGENGVTVLTPAGNTFGMETISHVGIRGKQAIAGNGVQPVDTVHYILDRQAQLWEFGEGLTFLDYSEYLSELGASPVLSYDPQGRLLYLCDGTKGFVYDPVAKSLGRGPVNVTGIGVQDGTRYITAPAAITIPLFELTTDTYDFGTRKAKSIQSIEIGIDGNLSMQVSIQYRQKIAAAFATTSWYTIDSRAVKPLNCYGYEFRFAFKALATGWGHLDYLRVNGRVHDH